MTSLNPYLKAAVGVLGAVVTSLAVIYPHATWLPVVTSVVTAITVYLVPNLPKNFGPPTQPMSQIELGSPVRKMQTIQKDTSDNPFGGNG